MSTHHDTDNDSFNSHNKIVGAASPASFNDPGESTSSIHVWETVRDKVFPRAKFLRLEDSECSEHKNSWCQKMGSWCQIEPNELRLWWQTAKKLFFKSWLSKDPTKETSWRMNSLVMWFIWFLSSITLWTNILCLSNRLDVFWSHTGCSSSEF